ncbi:MAG: ABC transporter permease [Erysipelotrichaceae bacterium]|nr:ABC transporter permease [Erysipelotrichaceae bacterium]
MLELLVKLREPLTETLLLTFIPLIISVVLGFLFGTLVFITSDAGILDVNANPGLKVLNRISDAIINVLRSVPYLIILIWLLPITKLLVGSIIGWKAAIPSLVVSATPFFARMTVIAFSEIPKGTIEASKALGASSFDIIFKVLLPESKPALLSSIAVTAINLISYSAMAGAIGAGGLGYEAYLYGLIRNNPPLMYMATFLIIVLVFGIQYIGDIIVRKVDKR